MVGQGDYNRAPPTQMDKVITIGLRRHRWMDKVITIGLCDTDGQGDYYRALPTQMDGQWDY